MLFHVVIPFLISLLVPASARPIGERIGDFAVVERSPDSFEARVLSTVTADVLAPGLLLYNDLAELLAEMDVELPRLHPLVDEVLKTISPVSPVDHDPDATSTAPAPPPKCFPSRQPARITKREVQSTAGWPSTLWHGMKEVWDLYGIHWWKRDVASSVPPRPPPYDPWADGLHIGRVDRYAAAVHGRMCNSVKEDVYSCRMFTQGELQAYREYCQRHPNTPACPLPTKIYKRDRDTSDPWSDGFHFGHVDRLAAAVNGRMCTIDDGRIYYCRDFNEREIQNYAIYCADIKPDAPECPMPDFVGKRDVATHALVAKHNPWSEGFHLGHVDRAEAARNGYWCTVDDGRLYWCRRFGESEILEYRKYCDREPDSPDCPMPYAVYGTNPIVPKPYVPRTANAAEYEAWSDGFHEGRINLQEAYRHGCMCFFEEDAFHYWCRDFEEYEIEKYASQCHFYPNDPECPLPSFDMPDDTTDPTSTNPSNANEQRDIPWYSEHSPTGPYAEYGWHDGEVDRVDAAKHGRWCVDIEGLGRSYFCRSPTFQESTRRHNWCLDHPDEIACPEPKKVFECWGNCADDYDADANRIKAGEDGY